MDGKIRNFGDALYEVFVDPETYRQWIEDDLNTHFPVGSVICNTVIEETLDLGYKPIFYDCGWRGEPLDKDLVKHCIFFGARGPHTQKELARHDVIVPVTMDSGYKIP